MFNAAHPPPQATLSQMAQMADALMWPLLVLRADGTLLHANRAARRLLANQSLLALRPDRRLGRLPASQQPAFERALAAARQGQTVVLNWPASEGHPAGTASLGPLGGTRETEPGTATGAGMDAAAGEWADKRADERPDGGELLLALSAVERTDGQLQAYARLHRLSPAETRVLLRLALGENSAEAAHALGVSTATVRSQVISLRRKTGHTSVLQLLRGLAGMPPVLTTVFLGTQGE